MQILGKIPYKNISPKTIELLDRARDSYGRVEIIMDSSEENVLLVVR
jgi:hypothetical protein